MRTPDVMRLARRLSPARPSFASVAIRSIQLLQGRGFHPRVNGLWSSRDGVEHDAKRLRAETSVSSLCAFCTPVAFHSRRVILRAGGLAGRAERCCPFTAVSDGRGSFLDVHRLM